VRAGGGWGPVEGDSAQEEGEEEGDEEEERGLPGAAGWRRGGSLPGVFPAELGQVGARGEDDGERG
jgi:hypothetical protein